MKQFIVGGRKISRISRTFVIAEIGLNHNGDATNAERMVQGAAACGADAVKFQTYVTEERVARSHPLFSLLRQCELDSRCHDQLKRLAESLGLVFLSTPFDIASVALLENLGVAAYKVASFHINDHALLRRIGKTGQPVILSRGASTSAEISAATQILSEAGCAFAILHCVSAYPTPLEDANLLAVRTLADTYECPIGYSDHTMGISAATWAVAIGARIIEKHFTIDRTMPGPDQALSADPGQFRGMVDAIRGLERAFGDGLLRPLDVESGIAPFRRHSA